APVLEASGLIFVTTAGAGAPAPVPLRITNVAGTAASFTAQATFAGGRTWFTHTPAGGTIPAGQSAAVSVALNLVNLPAGVYRGTLVLYFGESNASQNVELLLVLNSAGRCTPTALHPVFTQAGGALHDTDWEALALEVQVADNCGALATADSVTITASNGDAPLSLARHPGGRWTGAWTARTSTAQHVRLTATARQADQNLEGSADLIVTVRNRENIPVLLADGTVNAASGAFDAIVAPGTLSASYGAGLAAQNESGPAPPLPVAIQGAGLELAGQPVPLTFAGPAQINGVVPYGLATGTHALVARSGNRWSLPVDVHVTAAQPATFKAGATQGHIYIA
ncbi:MAG: hypothetical protein ACRD96_10575, partial [Bryobacteraceae bacterium]